MTLAYARPRMKDRTKTTPTLRTSGGTSVNSGTDAITVTIDSAAQVGDFAVICVASKSQTAPTVTQINGTNPLKYEYFTQIGDSASTPFMHIYSRWLIAGDVASDVGIGFTFTFGAGTTDGITGTYQVIANTSGFGVRPCSDFEANTDVSNSHQRPPPALMGMGAYDLYAGAAAALPLTATGTANCTLSGPPSGCTISTGTNVQALRAAGTGGTCRGQAMWTGPTHAARVESLTYPVGTVYTAAVAWTYSPVPQRWTATQQGPPSLAGLEVYNYSNSSGSCVVYSQSDVTRGCNTYRPWPERVAGAFGPVNAHLSDGTPKSNNMAMGGARAADICTAAFGTFSYTSVRAGSGNSAGQTNQYNPQVLTNTALPNRANIGLYTMDLVGNDFLKLGTDDATMAGAYNASDALIRLCRSGSQFNVSDSSQTYTGTWTDVSSDGYMGGAAKKTTVPGSKVSIAVTGVTAVNLVVIAYDDAAIGAAGSAFTVKVDGVVYPTQQTITLTNASTRGGSGSTFSIRGTTSNQHNATGVYKNYKFCQMTLPITGLTTSAHTITIEHAGSSGNEFVYNGYLIPAATPPWIVSNCIWTLPDATYTSAPYSFATAAVGKQTADWFNQIVRQVAAQFADARVIVYDPSEWGAWDPVTQGATPAGWKGWDTSVHVSAGDGLHPSDMGHAFDAYQIIRKLNERIVNPYTVHANPSSLVPTSLPATYTLLGKRQITLASNWTGILEVEGGGGAGGGGGVGLQGRGGGGGAYAKKNSFTLTAGCVIEIIVGSGGAGSAGAAGTSGTVSKVTYISGPDFAANTVLASADFGTGGQASTGTVGQGGLAANCVGDVKTSGSNGSTTTGGAGAAPLGGSGGAVGGNAGSTYGGGGGGGNSGTQNAGGAGAQGVVKFT